VLTSEFLVEVNDALRGTDDDAPTFGDDEANYWVRILNRKKRELYEDVTQTWANTFDGTRTLGTISASATPTFDTEDDFLAPSDKVYVVTTEDQVVEYNVIKPQERLRFRREVYIAGMDPQVLYFSKEINEDENIVGGTLFLPGYYMPDDITAATDTLPFLSPDWAVLAVAAEVAGNDIVYEDKEANLTTKANNLYTLMVRKNRRGTYGNPRTTPTVVNRIRGVR
jgi:hypothetical protein